LRKFFEDYCGGFFVSPTFPEKEHEMGEAGVFVCDMFFLLFFFKDFDQTREAFSIIFRSTGSSMPFPWEKLIDSIYPFNGG